MDDIPRSILLLVLILARGFFGSLETTYTTCNKIRLKTLAEEDNNKRAALALKVLDRKDDALVALLIAQNVLAIFSAAAATSIFLRLFSGNEAVASVFSTVVMTIIIYIIGETFPKNIANANSDRFAIIFSRFMLIFMTLLKPLVFIFSKLSSLIRKRISKDKVVPTLTEDELHEVINTIEEEGVLQKSETKIIRSAIEFGDKTVKDVMKGIDEVVAFEINSSPKAVLNKLMEVPYSRIPIYVSDFNHIKGVLQTKNYLEEFLDETKKLSEVNLLQPIYTKSNTEISKLFEEMGRRKTHIAIVRESGKNLGIVTMEDLIEEIVGEIYDEDEEVDPAQIEKELMIDELPTTKEDSSSGKEAEK